uniref:Predicted protein n=1 Tax=Physcomitrium patens TaxID=3218 RepID=A9U5K2_PHYPA
MGKREIPSKLDRTNMLGDGEQSWVDPGSYHDHCFFNGNENGTENLKSVFLMSMVPLEDEMRNTQQLGGHRTQKRRNASMSELTTPPAETFGDLFKPSSFEQAWTGRTSPAILATYQLETNSKLPAPFEQNTGNFILAQKTTPASVRAIACASVPRLTCPRGQIPGAEAHWAAQSGRADSFPPDRRELRSL